MSIKLKITLFSSQDTSWPDPPVNCCRKKFNTFNTSSWKALQNQGFTISPFSIKETWLPTHREWVFGTLIHHLLGLQSFWIKFLFLAPTTQLLTCWITGLLSKENELGLSCTWQAPHCLLPAMITGSERPHWVLPPRWETLTPRRLSQQGNLSINHPHSVSSCRLWDICWSSWIWEKKETSKQSEEGWEPEVEELFCKRTLDTLQSYSRLTGIVCGLGYFSRWSICILTAISWGQNALSRKKPLFLPKTPPQAWVTVPPIAWGRRRDHCCCPR